MFLYKILAITLKSLIKSQKAKDLYKVEGAASSVVRIDS